MTLILQNLQSVPPLAWFTLLFLGLCVFMLWMCALAYERNLELRAIEHEICNALSRAQLLKLRAKLADSNRRWGKWHRNYADYLDSLIDEKLERWSRSTSTW